MYVLTYIPSIHLAACFKWFFRHTLVQLTATASVFPFAIAKEHEAHSEELISLT